MNQGNGIVTIVVPCFNNEASIAETIKSVLAQTTNKWEMVCVDDGSTDNTVNVIKKYADNDARIKLLRRDKEPKGGPHCRNIGARAAIGEFLVFLDGDDLLAPTCIEKRHNTIKDINCDFVIFPMGFFKGESPTNNIFSGTQLRRELDYLYYYASGNAGWTITSPIFRKSFFLSLGGFDESFLRLQDIELNLRAIIAAHGNYKIMYNEEYDCFYRFGGSISSSMPTKLKNALISYEKFYGLVKLFNKQQVFPNKKMLSKAVLNVFCNAFIEYDILKIKYGQDLSLPNWLKIIDAQYLIIGKERLLLKILSYSSHTCHMNYYLARFISKMIRNSITKK